MLMSMAFLVWTKQEPQLNQVCTIVHHVFDFYVAFQMKGPVVVGFFFVLIFTLFFIFISVVNLACVLQEANEILKEWRATKAPQQNWGQRSTVFNESWAAICEGLLNTLVSGHAIDKTSCMKCAENAAVVHCYNCHIHSRLCWHCDQLVHAMHPFHDRSALISGFLKPIPPSFSFDSDGKWVSIGVYNHTMLLY